MRRVLLAAFLFPALGVCQSVYSLEVLPSEHFEPREKYTAITGLHIDLHGNIAGLASKEIGGGRTKTTGFLWRASADPVRPLVWGDGAAASPCIPRGFDAAGHVFLNCGTNARNVLFLPEENTYREARPGELLAETFGAADSWSVGAYPENDAIRATRAKADGARQTLAPAKTYRDSSALAVNSKGEAVGISGMLAGALDGSGKSIVSGLAAYWPPEKEEPRLVASPPKSNWTPQVARAISDDGMIAGSTSPSAAPMPVCLGAPSAPQITRAFVTNSTDGRLTAELLPAPLGDPAAESMTPTAVNSVPQIIGNRETLECIEGTLVKERRAVRWRKENSAWVAELIDRLPITLTAVCFRELVLMEANSTNENGQLTGTGTCVDQSDERITFAYRLTPIGPEELPLR